MNATIHMESPIGLIVIQASERGVTRADFVDGTPVKEDTGNEASLAHARHAQRELAAYFAGALRDFTVALDPTGTTFQRSCWAYLSTIPYGQTRAYLDEAIALGDAAATRAVGAANGKNPISIIVPCHRVIARSGVLQGYAGGLHRKRWLLDHEAMHASKLEACVAAPVLFGT